MKRLMIFGLVMVGLALGGTAGLMGSGGLAEEAHASRIMISHNG